MSDDEMFARLDVLARDLSSLQETFKASVLEKFSTGGAILHAACQGKKRYTTVDAAGKAATSAKAKGSTDELRIYSCAFCQQFHLTKTTLAMLAGVAP